MSITYDGQPGGPKRKLKSVPKKIPSSIESQWASACIKDRSKPWRLECERPSLSAGMMYRWNGIYFEAMGLEGGKALAGAWLAGNHQNKCTASKAEACHKTLEMALRGNPQYLLKKKDLPIIPTADTYLHIENDGTIKALPVSPDHGMTYAIDIKTGAQLGQPYVPGDLPQWSKFRKFLEHAQPDPEVQNLIQELCGSTLIPQNFSIAAWHYGAAGSGKSTLAEICLRMSRAAASVRLRDLASRFGLEGLLGASLVYVDEVDAGEKIPEGLLKTLISQNHIMVDRKNEKAMTTRIAAKWIICSNAKPFVRDKSDGVWRRLCPIPWEYQVPEKERVPNYHEVLWEEEGRLILDWMLKGAVRLVQRGHFLAEEERPEVIRSAKEYAREESDSVRAWVHAHKAKRDMEIWIQKSHVFQCYVDWCDLDGLEPLAQPVFWRNLKPMLGLPDDSRRSANGSRPLFQAISYQALPETHQ